MPVDSLKRRARIAIVCANVSHTVPPVAAGPRGAVGRGLPRGALGAGAEVLPVEPVRAAAPTWPGRGPVDLLPLSVTASQHAVIAGT
jgi:hypothetical protein